MDRIRLKRLEERDKKRIAVGYQQLLAKRSAKEEARKASLKASDPEESQRLIDSFNKAQEISLANSPNAANPVEKKTRRSSKKKLQPPEIVPAAAEATPILRAASLRRRSSPRHRNSTSDDADDEYATERKKSSDSNSISPPKALINGKTPDQSKKTKSGVETKEFWIRRLFSRKTAEEKLLEKQEKEKKLKLKKSLEKQRVGKLTKWKIFKLRNQSQILEIKRLTKKCIANTIILAIFCGLGGLMFRFTEGALENFYKCGAKKVKRDFLDQLWAKSHSMREEEWKSMARNKLRTFEEELQNAFDGGVSNHRGQNAWSFVNSCIYCFSVITTIGNL